MTMGSSLLLLALATTPALALLRPLSVAYGRSAVRTRSPPARAMIEDDPPPPEVVEAEENATPNRKWRLVGAGAGAGISLGSGCLSVAILLGQPDAMYLRDLVLFDSPVISLLINTIVCSTCVWAWNQVCTLSITLSNPCQTPNTTS